MYAFILIFNFDVVYSSDSSFTTNIPMKDKIKNTSIWFSFIMKNRNSIHIDSISVIFEDTTIFPDFIFLRFFFFFNFLSDLNNAINDPIKINVSPIFMFK